MEPDLRAVLLDAVAIAAALRAPILAQPRNEETLRAQREGLSSARERLTGATELCEARRAGLDLVDACEEALACCTLDRDPLDALSRVARDAGSVERLLPDHDPSTTADWIKNPIV